MNYKQIIALSMAFFCYVAVPVVVLLTSFLVMTEAGTELDVLMNCTALLFLLEVNNYLHIATHSDRHDRWKVTIPKENAAVLNRAKSHFTFFSFLSMLFIGIGMSWLMSDLKWAAGHVWHSVNYCFVTHPHSFFELIAFFFRIRIERENTLS